ncbi:MAG: nucleoside-triphosphatase [Bacteroidota bacterium]
MDNKVIIITGEKAEGKTTKLLKIIDLLKERNVSLAGFIALGEWKNGERSTYTLVDIVTGKSTVICTANRVEGYAKYGKFYFNPMAISFGEELLFDDKPQKTVIVIDEVGPFELDNKVWHKLLVHYLKNTTNTLLLSVRKMLVADVVEKYRISDASVYTVEESSNVIVKEILANVI